METENRSYQNRVRNLDARLRDAGGNIRVVKKTTSNLFRYQPRRQKGARKVSLGNFTHILDIDTDRGELEVEGLATYDAIVQFTLRHGFLPTVAPELRHITIGGAIVGIGIESSCYRHGFVHDGLLEADVMLPDGRVVHCRPDNEHADLFRALPNSYGTLGYILRARIRLCPAAPFVRLRNRRFTTIEGYVDAMAAAARDPDHDFVEGLFYKEDELYLTTATLTTEGSDPLNIYRNVYYRRLREDTELTLRTEDYIFRYDPDWFWNVPEDGLFTLFRRFAPRSVRRSNVYNRYKKTKDRVTDMLGIKEEGWEPLIQDWEVPWEHAVEFTRFLLQNVDIQDQPWAALPIVPRQSPTLYPVRAGEMYFNVGCYCYAETPPVEEDHHYTRILDAKCFALGGIKMLYSTTFLSREEFDRIYNGATYQELKQRYDPSGNAPDLFRKAVLGG